MKTCACSNSVMSAVMATEMSVPREDLLRFSNGMKHENIKSLSLFLILKYLEEKKHANEMSALHDRVHMFMSFLTEYCNDCEEPGDSLVYVRMLTLLVLVQQVLIQESRVKLDVLVQPSEEQANLEFIESTDNIYRTLLQLRDCYVELGSFMEQLNKLQAEAQCQINDLESAMSYWRAFYERTILPQSVEEMSTELENIIDYLAQDVTDAPEDDVKLSMQAFFSQHSFIEFCQRVKKFVSYCVAKFLDGKKSSTFKFNQELISCDLDLNTLGDKSQSKHANSKSSSDGGDDGSGGLGIPTVDLPENEKKGEGERDKVDDDLSGEIGEDMIYGRKEISKQICEDQIGGRKERSKKVATDGGSEDQIGGRKERSKKVVTDRGSKEGGKKVATDGGSEDQIRGSKEGGKKVVTDGGSKDQIRGSKEGGKKVVTDGGNEDQIRGRKEGGKKVVTDGGSEDQIRGSKEGGKKVATDGGSEDQIRGNKEGGKKVVTDGGSEDQIRGRKEGGKKVVTDGGNEDQIRGSKEGGKKVTDGGSEDQIRGSKEGGKKVATDGGSEDQIRGSKEGGKKVVTDGGSEDQIGGRKEAIRGNGASKGRRRKEVVPDDSEKSRQVDTVGSEEESSGGELVLDGDQIRGKEAGSENQSGGREERSKHVETENQSGGGGRERRSQRIGKNARRERKRGNSGKDDGGGASHRVLKNARARVDVPNDEGDDDDDFMIYSRSKKPKREPGRDLPPTGRRNMELRQKRGARLTKHIHKKGKPTLESCMECLRNKYRERLEKKSKTSKLRRLPGEGFSLNMHTRRSALTGGSIGAETLKEGSGDQSKLTTLRPDEMEICIQEDSEHLCLEQGPSDMEWMVSEDSSDTTAGVSSGKESGREESSDDTRPAMRVAANVRKGSSVRTESSDDTRPAMRVAANVRKGSSVRTESSDDTRPAMRVAANVRKGSSVRTESSDDTRPAMRVAANVRKGSSVRTESSDDTRPAMRVAANVRKGSSVRTESSDDTRPAMRVAANVRKGSSVRTESSDDTRPNVTITRNGSARPAVMITRNMAKANIHENFSDSSEDKMNYDGNKGSNRVNQMPNKMIKVSSTPMKLLGGKEAIIQIGPMKSDDSKVGSSRSSTSIPLVKGLRRKLSMGRQSDDTVESEITSTWSEASDEDLYWEKSSIKMQPNKSTKGTFSSNDTPRKSSRRIWSNDAVVEETFRSTWIEPSDDDDEGSSDIGRKPSRRIRSSDYAMEGGHRRKQTDEQGFRAFDESVMHTPPTKLPARLPNLCLKSASSFAPKKKPSTKNSSSPNKKSSGFIFTDEETEYLVDGIKKIGFGRWKAILLAYPFHYSRNSTSLKDKARNLKGRPRSGL